MRAAPGIRPRVGEVVLGWSDPEEPMAWFVNAQVLEVVQPFWAALQRGEFIADAVVPAGT